jgi:hypothetical protein
MFDTQFLVSTRDTVLASIPFIVLLIMALFRLDEMVAAPRRRRKRMHRVLEVDAAGEPILCDPDGRPVPPQRIVRPRKRSHSDERGKPAADAQPRLAEA